MNRQPEPPFTAWCGRFAFGRDHAFFVRAVALARTFVDKGPEKRPPEGRFYEELESLRDIAPPGGRVLLDQLVHRWEHPHCPPSLYVVTCTLRAPQQGALLDGSGERVQELLCTKVGRTAHTVAARIERYRTEILGGVEILEGSQELRVVVYGDRPTMLMEREVQDVARNGAPPAQVIDEADLRRRVGRETYVGVEMVEAICTFVQRRAQQAAPP